MKRIVCLLISILIMTGCGNISNTPTKQVEGFFNQYQILDEKVLTDLDSVIEKDDRLANNQETKEKYREIIKKQYKNLAYKIKEEKIDGDVATVTAEITVYDFTKVLAEAEVYKNQHTEEFKNNDGNFDDNKFINYELDMLKEAKDKVKYTLDLKLSKIDEKWQLDGIDSDTENKILGIYEK